MMNIKELLSRPSPSTYTVTEACFIVEQYILREKGVDMRINLYKNIDISDIMNPITEMMMTRQLQLLNIAFLKASELLKL
ncbi:MAG: hypothetical protein LBM02_09875 [Lachnospiraceae bacterium]|jgi:hypothetical protein|nr:hypothetical protein [Lachnospiraceae bacterium]